MPDRSDDFWPKHFLTEASASPPVDLLKRQAEILAERTNGRVEGVVRESVVGGTLIDSLYLKAPALGDYAFKILNIAYPITRDPKDPFPITVEDTFSGRSIELPDIDHFEDWLKSVLSSEAVAKVIGNLIRHSQASVAS